MTKYPIIFSAIIASSVVGFFLARSRGGLSAPPAVSPPLSFMSQSPAVPVVLANTYRHASPAFSMELPVGFSVSSFDDSGGQIVLVRGPSGEFQIFITVQNKDFVVTEARIREDIPDIAIKNPRFITVGSVPALAFDGAGQSPTKTREVWFEYRNFLYQATSVADSGSQMEKILASWKFL